MLKTEEIRKLVDVINERLFLPWTEAMEKRLDQLRVAQIALENRVDQRLAEIKRTPMGTIVGELVEVKVELQQRRDQVDGLQQWLDEINVALGASPFMPAQDARIHRIAVLKAAAGDA